MDNIRHFFGLKRDPFPQNIAVKDLYPLPSLEPLQKRVAFAIEQKAIRPLPGTGAGKSTSLATWSPLSPQIHQISLVGGLAA